MLTLILASLELSAAWVAHATQTPHYAELHCLNKACPLYGLIGKDNVLLHEKRRGGLIWCCAECGSRFTAYYLLATADEENALEQESPGIPSLEAIHKERQCLAKWRQQLQAACEKLVGRDWEVLLVEKAFQHASLPQDRWVYAPRLGFVALVETYMRRQAERQCVEFAEQAQQEIEMLAKIKRGEIPIFPFPIYVPPHMLS